MGLLKKKIFDFNKCYNQGASGDCNLIQILKELQAQKREADSKIDAYTKHSKDVVSNFIMFLAALEEQGCFRLCKSSSFSRELSGINLCFDSEIGMLYLENVLKNYSIDDIQILCDELKALSYKKRTIDEQRKISNKLGAEIKQIKDSLGIE